MQNKVKEIMTEDPACCTPNTDLMAVARMMLEHNCGEIPVVENKENMQPVGVITDRDIVCRIVAQGKNPLKLYAKHSMSSPCISVSLDTPVEECLRIMEDHQIRRIPVVDQNQRCCGIVAQADIARQPPQKKTAGAAVR